MAAAYLCPWEILVAAVVAQVAAYGGFAYVHYTSEPAVQSLVCVLQ